MWNKGSIRIKGPVQNLRSFVKNEVSARDLYNESIPGGMKSIVDRPGTFWYSNETTSPLVSGLHKGIINNQHIAVHAETDNDVRTIRLSFRTPRDINVAALLAHSEKYGVGIGVYLVNDEERTARNLQVTDGQLEYNTVHELALRNPRIIRESTYA